jgi:hypothetical protein
MDSPIRQAAGNLPPGGDVLSSTTPRTWAQALSWVNAGLAKIRPSNTNCCISRRKFWPRQGDRAGAIAAAKQSSAVAKEADQSLLQDEPGSHFEPALMTPPCFLFPGSATRPGRGRRRPADLHGWNRRSAFGRRPKAAGFYARAPAKESSWPASFPPGFLLRPSCSGREGPFPRPFSRNCAVFGKWEACFGRGASGRRRLQPDRLPGAGPLLPHRLSLGHARRRRAECARTGDRGRTGGDPHAGIAGGAAD